MAGDYSVDALVALGVRSDTTIRMDANEISKTLSFIQPITNSDERCIVSNVLGGAREDSDLWPWESKELTAQTTCKVGLKFEDVCDSIQERSGSALGQFIFDKGTKAKSVVAFDAEKTANEPVKDAIVGGLDTVADAIKNPWETWGQKLLVTASVVLVVVAVGAAAVLVFELKAAGK